jgi:lysophospholipid acyltransferase (LPLAT)-like uncharacterized protein
VSRRVRTALGIVLGLFVRVYLKTLRLHVEMDPALDAGDRSPWVLCFWHGEQVPLLCWRRRRPTVALVSHSADGQLQAQILRWQGLGVERGSTSRGGARGLLRIVRRLRRGHDGAFAVDGPRGPLHAVSPGARLAAARSRGTLVPMGSYAARGLTLGRSWDQLRLPRPFSRVHVRLGAPLAADTAAASLAVAIERCSDLARSDARMLASRRHALLRHAERA